MSEKREDCLFQLPRNIRQVGQTIGDNKIYIEDYVMSMITFLGKKASEHPRIAIFLGEQRCVEGKHCVFISGAVEIEGIDKKVEGCFPKEMWEIIYRTIEENFSESNIVGWLIAKTGMYMEPSEQQRKLHKENFSGKYKVLWLYDPLEREESVWINQEHGLEQLQGYYVYYERNPEMQEYLLKVKGKVEREKVEEKALQEMKRKLGEMDLKHKKQKKIKGYIRNGTVVVGVLAFAVIFQKESLGKNIATTFVEKTTQEQEIIQTDCPRETEAIEEQPGEKISIASEDVVDDTEKEEAAMAEITGKQKPGQYYTIQPGDTLVNICMEKFQSLDRMPEIMKINKIQDKDKIVAGQVLKLWE